MPDFILGAVASVIFGYFGWLMFEGIVKIYRNKEGNPIQRLIVIICGIFLGTMWMAVPVVALLIEPVGTIFGLIVIVGVLFLVMKSEDKARR